MSAGTEPPLVGRQHELEALARLLDDLADASSALVLQVAGEPGIGKSRLLRELRTVAGARGHLVLSGRAAEFEAELPFGVFGDALDDWLTDLPAERLAALAGTRSADLAGILPAFEALAAGGAPQLEQERYRAYRAVRALLSALAVDAPVVLVLDDMQWADPGSIELICHLLAHAPRGQDLLALGFRPHQVPPLLNAGLAAADREQGARRLDLVPLDLAAAGELLGPEVAGPARDTLYLESGGNPFFLLQLARRDTFGDRRPAAAGGGASTVPEAVRAALANELSSLSAPSMVLLQGAAVAGDPFEAHLAAAAADVGDAGALELMEELLRSELVHPTVGAPQFAFRHPIVRSTVYELAAGGWRARAHARIAAVLAAEGAGPSVRAPHVERSARKGDAEAIALLVAAGAASAPRAPALAARWYASALRLLPEGPEAEAQRIELLIAMATALGASGHLEESRGALCQVLERLPDRHPGRVPIVAYCAGVEHVLGRHRVACARLAQAHRGQRGRRSVEAVLLEIELAAGAGYENRADDMLAWAEQALEGAATLNLPALEVAATGQVALARYFLGLPAAEAIARAAAGLDALDDAALAGRLDIGLWVGWTEAVLERHERAVEHCQRVLDVSRATGQGATLLVTMTAQAWALLRMGHLDEADEVLTAAIETGHLAPHLFLSVAVGLSSVVRTHRGQLDAAVRAGEESVRLAGSADPGLIPGMSGLYLATPLIEKGEAGRARDIVLTMSGGGDLRTSRSGHTAAYEVLTRAELALGRPAAAEAWAERAVAATHGRQLAAAAAFADRAVAAVALARGDAPEAARICIVAAETADEAGAPIEAGRCRILAARALAGSDQREEAIGELKRAAAELGRVGADGYRVEAEQALRRLGARVGRRAKAGPEPGGLGALTEREREVAQLVRQGRTNREIATALSMSEKSVERHLSHVFVKLGVARRTELALYVASDQGS